MWRRPTQHGRFSGRYVEALSVGTGASLSVTIRQAQTCLAIVTGRGTIEVPGASMSSHRTGIEPVATGARSSRVAHHWGRTA